MGIESGRKRCEFRIDIESAYQSGSGRARPAVSPTNYPCRSPRTARSGRRRISTRFARGESAFYRSDEAAPGGEPPHSRRLNLRTQVRRHPPDRGQVREKGFATIAKQK